jgi:hypothetical protein
LSLPSDEGGSPTTATATAWDRCALPPSEGGGRRTVATTARMSAPSRYAPAVVLLEVTARPVLFPAGRSPHAQASDGKEVAAYHWPLAPACSLPHTQPNLGERRKLVVWSPVWIGEKRGMCGAHGAGRARVGSPTHVSFRLFSSELVQGGEMP